MKYSTLAIAVIGGLGASFSAVAEKQTDGENVEKIEVFTSRMTLLMKMSL